ncbi:MAG: ATP-binding cassette domain-containing protein [Oscillospiraceae bacterium]|nr:ATP-binding cassette domain-containing protein [Oscillospiraceae bacterium]
MLKISELCKSYKSCKALNKFSFSFESGIYALLGPNGSGKSTLMNVLTNNLISDSGDISLDGERISEMKDRYFEQIGYMPQYCPLYLNFKAIEMLYYIAELKGVKRDEAKKQAFELLSAVELTECKDQYIKTFSGGMKQRLSLICAMLGKPKILLLDEPSAGLDPKQRIVIRNVLSSAALDSTLIIATHIVSDIEYTAKEAILLKKGEIVDHGHPDALAGKMSGRVWSIECDTEKAERMKSEFPIVNIIKSGNGVKIKLLSDIRPDAEAEEAEPTLEDYYLSVFGGAV